MDHDRSLEGLLDKAEIINLIHAYCSHFDRAEADEVLALFTEDAVWDWRHGNIILTGHAGLLKGFTHRCTSGSVPISSHTTIRCLPCYLPYFLFFTRSLISRYSVWITTQCP